MNICVTGGAGYIGSVLTERLLGLGHDVTVVDIFLQGYHGIARLAAHPKLKVVQRDIRHENRDYLNKQDVIFHLAAVSSAGACETMSDLAWAVNSNTTKEITKSLRRDALLVFASTTAMYGDRGGKLVNEEPILHSADGTYSQTKLAAEKWVQYDDNTIILRLGTVYGISPLMRPNSIVNDFVRMAVQDKQIVLYDHLTTRPYVHIGDCVDGLLFAMDHAKEMDRQRYDLGGMNHSKRNVAEMIQRQIDCEILISSTSRGLRQDFKVESSKIKILGFDCKRSLYAGIIDLIKLYSFYRP